MVAMVFAHLLFSWSWIASLSRRLFAAHSARTRINYLLNLSLFAAVTAVIFSGILISQKARPRKSFSAAHREARCEIGARVIKDCPSLAGCRCVCRIDGTLWPFSTDSIARSPLSRSEGQPISLNLHRGRPGQAP